MELFLKMYLPVYLLLYVAAAFVLPTYKTWKRTGINPVTFGSTGSAHDYIGLVMKILIALLFAAVLCFSIGGEVYQYIVPVEYLQAVWLKITGMALIHIALIWIVIAQHQMGTSWRIGIDEANKTALKTKGIFGISRNPVFLGITASALGIFLIIPNALTFFTLLTTYFIIHIQIRLEEAFLAKEHGQLYLEYTKKVRRLI